MSNKLKLFSQQIGSLNQTVEELNQDISVVMDQLINDSRKDVNTSADRCQDSMNST